jgi:hypothetical protein
MVHALFLFPKSADPKQVDDILANRFIPAHKQARDVRSLKISSGELMSPGGPPPYAKVVEVSFDSLSDMMAFVQSQPPDERDRVKDLGTLILMYEVNEL